MSKALTEQNWKIIKNALYPYVVIFRGGDISSDLNSRNPAKATVMDDSTLQMKPEVKFND